MTTKDYVKIAAVIRNVAADGFCDGCINTIDRLVDDLCTVFKEDNGRFKEDVFLRACGLQLED